MTGLLKDKDWNMIPGGWRIKMLRKATAGDYDKGQQPGAPGFTKFQKPTAKQSTPNARTPLGG
jgi:hypothetical protein